MNPRKALRLNLFRLCRTLAHSTAEVPSSAADIGLIFHRSTAFDATMTLTFSPCDEDNCIADLDGQVTLVKISDVQSLRDAFAALMQA